MNYDDVVDMYLFEDNSWERSYWKNIDLFKWCSRDLKKVRNWEYDDLRVRRHVARFTWCLVAHRLNLIPDIRRMILRFIPCLR